MCLVDQVMSRINKIIIILQIILFLLLLGNIVKLQLLETMSLGIVLLT